METPKEQQPLVPDDFVVPPGLRTSAFVLEPLQLRHNESDLAAWTSSMAHIRATPGFADHGWPERAYTLAENARDLDQHEKDAAARTGFTYTVLDPETSEVIGCVYFYPPRRPGYDVDVRSWVRADHAVLDKHLYNAVTKWLAESWPFQHPDYASR